VLEAQHIEQRNFYEHGIHISGCWVISTPIEQAAVGAAFDSDLRGEVMRRAIRSCPTAAKSS